MILYTPMQLELVLEGFEEMKFPQCKEVEYKGVPMLVEDVGYGRKRIIKLLSTCPYDYLKAELFPGQVIDCSYY
ncbi:MAG TPA: YlzJ-like family protein [Bacillota bacterium]|nr:YlzJ-like family protein [Bacillota bacterium]